MLFGPVTLVVPMALAVVMPVEIGGEKAGDRAYSGIGPRDGWGLFKLVIGLIIPPRECISGYICEGCV